MYWHDVQGLDWLWMTLSMTAWVVLLGVVLYLAIRLGLDGRSRRR